MYLCESRQRAYYNCCLDLCDATLAAARLGSQLRQHGARPTALWRRNRRACRRNGKRGKGQRFPHGCPPSRPQSLCLLHGAESILCGCSRCARKNTGQRCTFTSRTLQPPVKSQQAGAKTPAPLKLFSAALRAVRPQPPAVVLPSTTRSAVEALASHVALPSRRSLLITLGLPNYQQ